MVKLAKIFQDDMTFQRNKPCKVWGTSSEVQTVTIYMNEKEVAERELPQGDFTFFLPPQEAAQNVTVRIGNDVVLRNVDFGEVWFAGGQSNMEFPMKYDSQFEEMKNSQPDEHLRYYEVAKYSFEGEEEEGLKSNQDWNCWRCLTSETIGSFSAVAVYFAMELRKHYNIPVAIVSCNWGGTSASAWISREMLEADEELAVYLREYEENLAHLDMEAYYQISYAKRKGMGSPFAQMINDFMMKNTVTMEQVMQHVGKLAAGAGMDMQGGAAENSGMSQESFMVTGPHDENRPCGLYESMLSKAAGFTIRGVIWYQGESDDTHPDIYEKLFTRLVEQLRKDWAEDIPVIYAQLAPFESWMQCRGDKFPELRKQQFDAWEHIDNVYMISTSDCGNRFDIHPKNKQPIGMRMALSARQHVYGEAVQGDAPIAAEMKVQDKQICIRFDNAASLHLEGQEFQELEIYADGEKCAITGWSVSGDTLIVSIKDSIISNEITVAFAQTPYYQVCLFNENGLPAFPFVLQKRK